MKKPDFSFWEQLLRRPVGEMIALSGGRNSRVWQLIDEHGQHFVAKEYFSTSADPRNRLVTEWASLNFLYQQGLHCVPRPVVCDTVRSCAIYTFVAGESPASYGTEVDALLPVADFVCKLYDIRAAAQAASLPCASEACFALQEIAEQLHRRFQPLLALDGTSAVQRDCLAFLHKCLVPHMEDCLCAARAKLARVGLEIHSVLPPHAQIPSPSDLGFHNAIRQPDGTLCFVDFEYFGMDDPVKLLADVCLHPAMDLSIAQKMFFMEHVLQSVERQDTTVHARLKAYGPLWRLKWCAIILNEFVPCERARRNFAARTSPVRDQVLYQQLAKAKKMLEEYYHDIPYAFPV